MSLWNDELNEAHDQDLLQLSKKYHLAHQGLEAMPNSKVIAWPAKGQQAASVLQFSEIF